MVKEGYKETGVGVIPKDWDVTKLEEEYEFFVGGDLKVNDFSLLQDRVYKYRIYSNTLQNEGIYGYCSLPQYQGNSITITGRGDIGHCFYRKDKFSAIVRLLVCQPKSEINSLFVAEYFKMTCPFVFESTGVPQLTVPQIKNVEFPLPNIKEQNQIAQALSDMDSLIWSLEKLIKKKKAIKQGTMQELLTGKKRLNGFEGEWKSYKLDELLNYEQPTKYIVHSTEYTDQGTPVLTAGKSLILGYTNESDGIYDNLPVIIFDDFVTSSKFVNYKFKVKSSAMKMLTLRDLKMDLRLIYELMQMIDFMPSDHQRHWISQYSQFKIKLPKTFEEQNAIASILSDMDNEIEKLEEKIEKCIKIKQGMMQELLTGKIRLI